MTGLCPCIASTINREIDGALRTLIATAVPEEAFLRGVANAPTEHGYERAHPYLHVSGQDRNSFEEGCPKVFPKRNTGRATVHVSKSNHWECLFPAENH